MAKHSLVIVESPAKAKTISALLADFFRSAMMSSLPLMGL